MFKNVKERSTNHRCIRVCASQRRITVTLRVLPDFHITLTVMVMLTLTLTDLDHDVSTSHNTYSNTYFKQNHDANP